MTEDRNVSASIIGNPSGGLADNPWPFGQPARGDRVAIFSYQVTSVDGAAEQSNDYHVAPIEHAVQGPVGPSESDPQGITVRWVGLGLATVLRPADLEHGDRHCEVAPDNDVAVGGDPR